MNDSQLAWTQVWANATVKNEYSNNKWRVERALDKISHLRTLGIEFKAGEKILEAGCGDGAVILCLQQIYGVEGFGVDFAETAERQAVEAMRQSQSDFNFSVADIRNMPFPDGFFDKVVCLGVVEHMSDPVPALRELRRVLKRDGCAVIMTPNSFSLGRIDRILKQLLGAWTMGYQDEYSPKGLGALLLKAGFEKIKAQAVPRPALANDSWSRRWVSRIDAILRRFLGSWGFYSYVVGSFQKRNGK